MEHEKTLPNIIFFVADEFRGDCVSLDGKRNPIIKTPNIDQLAKGGVARDNMFIPTIIEVFINCYNPMKIICLNS